MEVSVRHYMGVSQIKQTKMDFCPPRIELECRSLNQLGSGTVVSLSLST